MSFNQSDEQSGNGESLSLPVDLTPVCPGRGKEMLSVGRVNGRGCDDGDRKTESLESKRSPLEGKLETLRVGTEGDVGRQCLSSECKRRLK